MFDRIIEIFRSQKWKIYLIGFFLLVFWAISSTLFPQVINLFQAFSEARQNRMRIRLIDDWGANVNKLKSENRKLKAMLEEIQLNVPQQDELSYILSLFSEAAESTKVNFSSIKPQEVQNYKQFRLFPFHLELIGTFHHLAQFLNLIETFKNVIKIEQLEIKTQGIVSDLLYIKLMLSVYYLDPVK